MSNDPNVKVLFGKFVREKRLDANKSIQELAEQSGISRVTLSLIENGHTTGGRKAIEKIATTLGLTYTDMREAIKKFETQ
jgi:transcriptional regulator with XRE-family HTH domain